MRQIGCAGHVFESPIAPIAVQTIRRRVAFRESFEAGTVHQKDILAPVIVVIEKRNAGSVGFNDVFLRLFASGREAHPQTGFPGNIGERHRKWPA